MKLVIKLYLNSVACIATSILFFSCLILAHQPITSIINVTNNQVFYSSVKGAGLYNPFNELSSSACSSEKSFDTHYNVPGNILNALQFFFPDFSSSAAIPGSTFVRLKRSANPIWIMQEKNLLKQAFC